MLTKHGDEFCEQYFSQSWDEFRDDVECIDVTPVNKWMDANRHDLTDVREDFGCVRPPWPHTWAEYVVNKDNGMKRVGLDLHYPSEAEIQTIAGRMPDGQYARLFESDDVATIVIALSFADLGSEWKEEGVVAIFLDEDGRVVEDPKRRFYPMPYDQVMEAVESGDRARKIVTSRTMPVCSGSGSPTARPSRSGRTKSLSRSGRSGRSPGRIQGKCSSAWRSKRYRKRCDAPTSPALMSRQSGESTRYGATSSTIRKSARFSATTTATCGSPHTSAGTAT